MILGLLLCTVKLAHYIGLDPSVRLFMRPHRRFIKNQLAADDTDSVPHLLVMRKHINR